MLVIGITGGVGAGKSSILKVLEEHCNCKIVLADEVGNKVKEPEQKCYQQIVGLLGNRILKKDGTINKAAMAAAIFSDAVLLEKVNAIIHPAVEEAILDDIRMEREKEEIDVFFLEAALLIEAGYMPYLDELWYVFGEKEIRKKRLKESRGYSDEKINQIMESQLPDAGFREYATVVLDNSYDFEDTLEQIKVECTRLNIWKK